MPINIRTNPLPPWDPSPSIFEAAKAELTREFGHTPHDQDVHWRLLNIAILETGIVEQFRSHRDIHFYMAEHMYRFRQFRYALTHYLIVAYFDLNNPQNLRGGGCVGRFEPEDGFLCEVVHHQVLALKHRLRLQTEAIRDCFLKEANRTKKDLGCPLEPENAWENLAPFWDATYTKG